MSAGDLIIIEATAGAQLFYLLLGSACAAIAAYFWWTWRQVGGIRGGMYMLLAACLAVILLGFSILHAADPHVPVIAVIAVQRAMWPGVLVALAVLADLYAADSNDHHSLTTRLYVWYKRLTAQPPGKRGQSEVRNEA